MPDTPLLFFVFKAFFIYLKELERERERKIKRMREREREIFVC